MPNPEIRQEEKSDYESVYELNNKAFGRDDESRIIKRVRESREFIPELSLVYEEEEKIIGHILFSVIYIKTDTGLKEILALAPMSVLPEYQGRGIGKKLVVAGLQKARKLGYGSVIVLGHNEYYPKFGFRKASEWNIKCPFDVPEEVFMAIELTKGILENSAGTVVYPDAFSK